MLGQSGEFLEGFFCRYFVSGSLPRERLKDLEITVRHIFVNFLFYQIFHWNTSRVGDFYFRFLAFI